MGMNELEAKREGEAETPAIFTSPIYD